MKNLCLLTLCGFLVGALTSSVEPVFGIDAFKKEFVAKYVKKDPTTDEEKAFAAAVTKANCNVCHVGKTKKVRNEYGKALDELLDKKADMKDTKKIQDALDKVGAMKSDPKNDASPTFGELFSQGKLPNSEAAGDSASAGN
jgi:hypothetical protein